MKRKIAGIIAALVLAAVGTVALVAYVQSAKDRAVADEELVEVVVVEDRVARGTPVSDLSGSVGIAEVPARLLADDVVIDLAGVDDELVTVVELRPGEQLLRSRLVDAAELRTIGVPDGLQEVTVALDPARAVGGTLEPGDTVGVVLSFDPFDLQAAIDPGGDQEPAPDGPAESTKSPNMTHLTFHKILVTRVQFDADEGGSSIAGGDDDEDVDTAPSSQLLVTLAVDSRAVEQVVFAAEFGHIWLTGEGADATEDGTRVVTLEDVFDPASSE